MEISGKLLKAKVQLIVHHPFFATLALKREYIEDDTIETACTNGEWIKFNPVFVESLSLYKTIGLIAHEVMHIAMLHHTRRQGRNPKKWNIACDYAINRILLDSGLELPDGALVNPIYDGKSAEQIYNMLPDGGDKNGKGGNDPGGCGGVVDSPAKSESEISEVEADAKQQLAQALAVGKREGNLPAGMERFVDEILNPKVNWKEATARFLLEIAKDDYNWKRPSPRYAHTGLYLPILENLKVGRVALIVDTSGSINNEILNSVSSEAHSLASDVGAGLDVIYVDTKVQRVESFEPNDDLILHPKGGGGTNFKPGFEYVEKNLGDDVKAIIYMTDGICGSFPTVAPDQPVLWVIYNNNNFNPPFGEVINVD